MTSNDRSGFSISNLMSPSSTMNQDAESGNMWRSCFVPGGSCTMNDTELPSLMIGSRHVVLP